MFGKRSQKAALITGGCFAAASAMYALWMSLLCAARYDYWFLVYVWCALMAVLSPPLIAILVIAWKLTGKRRDE